MRAGTGYLSGAQNYRKALLEVSKPWASVRAGELRLSEPIKLPCIAWEDATFWHQKNSKRVLVARGPVQPIIAHGATVRKYLNRRAPVAETNDGSPGSSF